MLFDPNTYWGDHKNKETGVKTTRRSFILQTTVLSGSLLLPHFVNQDTDQVRYFNVEDWGIEGKGWQNTQRYFQRLPDHAEGSVREPVWSLAQHSAGMSVRFRTNAPKIMIRASLLSQNLAMPHMPATGVSGFDLYGKIEEGNFQWAGVNKPEAGEDTYTLIDQMDPEPRTYQLYLPLYNGVEKLEIGVPSGSTFEPIAPETTKPIIFYGTSILQGACASRPGMAFTNILGRRLNLPIINLGFSGNGRMEEEVGSLLCELDPSLFAIDCLPNMKPEQVTERAERLVKQIRAHHPETPILLVEDRINSNAEFLPDRAEHHVDNHHALQQVFAQLEKEKIGHLFYLSATNLLASDTDATTDGSHPNDLGMKYYADAYEPVLRDILNLR